jgi:selenocysteine-specific elongation factor
VGEAADGLLKEALARGLLPWSQQEAESAAAETLEAVGSDSTLVFDLLAAVEARGDLVRYPDGFLIHASGHKTLLDRVKDHFSRNEELTVGQFRDMSDGLTRKYAIPILEHLDGKGYTLRQGDVRLPGPNLT